MRLMMGIEVDRCPFFARQKPFAVKANRLSLLSTKALDNKIYL